jgi:hypothetical protein
MSRIAITPEEKKLIPWGTDEQRIAIYWRVIKAVARGILRRQVVSGDFCNTEFVASKASLETGAPQVVNP